MKSLFDTTRLNGLLLKNRCIRSATWEGMANASGHMTKAAFETYGKLARGGVGLIITGLATITRPLPHRFSICDDSFIDEYERLASLVHKEGTGLLVQVGHLGSSNRVGDDVQLNWGPSAIPSRNRNIIPKEMDKDDIHALIRSFVAASKRAKRAGVDGVQLHVAHGTLLSKYLSPYYNRRTDEYGGGPHNRARIVYETYEAVRECVGDNCIVSAKINCEDFFEGGLVLDDSIQICQQLAERGMDVIEISGGHLPGPGEKNKIIRTGVGDCEPESYFRYQTDCIARAARTPVILVGGNRSIETVEDILATSPIEYISFSRPLIREPGLINRWQTGDRTPAKCIYCNRCHDHLLEGQILACVYHKEPGHHTD